MALEDFLKERLVKALSFAPTPCQEVLFKELSGFVTSDAADNPLMLVTGYAGTGKTSAMVALISLLKEYKRKYILLAPTGRAAKVLSGYTKTPAKTIHKQIYRQKSLQEVIGQFSLDINTNRETFFIVDECSLINTAAAGNSIFGSGNLLEDLLRYVYSNTGNKLILIGDPAQLPPIGMERSPALSPEYLSAYVPDLVHVHLTSVVRQKKESGILYNATILRRDIERNDLCSLQLKSDGFDDILRIAGGDLVETISDSIDKYGVDEVIVLCRSNARANKYNMGIRQSIFFKEEQLTRGDKLMVVKNCYQFLEDIPEMDFIANGDVANLESISKYEERYGFHFAQANLSFPDYDNIEISAKIILDTLTSTSPSLSSEEQRLLYEGVLQDYMHIKPKKKMMQAVREDIYFNALQIKYATAITTHKSQGGQWKCVFIDNPFWSETLNLDDKKWLYTAITRSTEMVYLVNFKDYFFDSQKYCKHDE